MSCSFDAFNALRTLSATHVAFPPPKHTGAGSSRHMIGLLLLFCISWAITTAGTYLHECSSAPDPFLCFCPSYELSLNLAKYACPSSYNTSAQYIYFSYSEDGTLTGAAELQAALYIFREATRSILPEMRLEVRDHTFHPGEGYTRRRTQEETELEGEALQVEQYPWASRAAQLNLARETIEMSVSGPPTGTSCVCDTHFCVTLFIRLYHIGAPAMLSLL